MNAIWSFLNSPLGITLIVGLAGKLFATAVKNQTRREKLLDYATTAFQLAEMMGARQGLGGNAKYLIFVEQVVEKLKAMHEPELSTKEKEALERLAYEKSWLSKPPAAPPLKLPLPPPPRG